MADIFVSQAPPPDGFRAKAITVFGFGAQGMGQAQNLKDTGCRVTVCLYPGSRSIGAAKAAGLTVMTDPVAAARQTEVAVLLTPDAVIPGLWDSSLREALPAKSTLIFAHGFTIHYNLLTPRPTQDVLLVAPMGHGSILRQKFLEGSAIPAVLAVHQDASGHGLETARAFAQAIGCARMGAIASTMKEETETDLFSEQTAVVGGFVELIRAAFTTMVDAGYQPEIAYWSTLRELEGMARIMATRGLAGGVAGVSATARFGAITRGPRLVNATTRQEMQKILNEICSGQFLGELQAEAQAGYPKSQSRVTALREELLNQIHEKFKP
jgi:ketol-acid reductoisomerase